MNSHDDIISLDSEGDSDDELYPRTTTGTGQIVQFHHNSEHPDSAFSYWLNARSIDDPFDDEYFGAIAFDAALDDQIDWGLRKPNCIHCDDFGCSSCLPLPSVCTSCKEEFQSEYGETLCLSCESKLPRCPSCNKQHTNPRLSNQDDCDECDEMFALLDLADADEDDPHWKQRSRLVKHC
jgi:hypothetical protein